MGPTPTPPSAPQIRRTTSAGGGSGSIILDKYQLGRLLGRGSFAKVYLARLLDHPDAAEVAIKVIDKAATVDAAMEPRIVREVSAMRRLHHHPNILNLHEVMATKTKIYLVMELAPGGELFAKLSRCRRFSESAARRYFHQVISALRFCHQNGVFHRDIKPQNLLLDHNGILKITDFGLSALSEHKIDGLVRTACGTPAYTAPEVVSRKGYDGEKADAWSCGVLLYVFLVGNLPFDDTNLSNMYRAMHRRALEFPDWVSKSAKIVIYRLLDPNPSTRLSLDELIKHSWFKKSFSEENLRSQGDDKAGSGSEFLDSKGFKFMPRVNAFDLISMSSGLNLSGLFEEETSSKEMRFTSGMAVVEIEEKVRKAGLEFGYTVERGKGGGIRLVKGRAVAVVVEIWEVAAELWLVELRLIDGAAEFGELQWGELRSIFTRNDVVA
ncbi:CBL-interacting serine/threonine-protein kinase 7-like [Salvia miltiorrhiza]|uniref:CBL-interacting serine/threonine-protein kinase 7-like n=1 Tax=Salvia miltiorrhiza TaxID=226208 RepID=UPI0025ABB82B|nr:CBL-interacting serine/threonine-protein kinase 7-like [Salvia miltiorrhiza]XP_057771435.1 CBL-interacting serine/threonine-protein kinase 7-like [Salvia miltiorrhiza]